MSMFEVIDRIGASKSRGTQFLLSNAVCVKYYKQSTDGRVQSAYFHDLPHQWEKAAQETIEAIWHGAVDGPRLLLKMMDQVFWSRSM